MIVTLISSVIIAVFITGLAATRYYKYYNRRKNESKDLSYSVSRYWRRQFASTSFDSVVSSPPIRNNQPNNQEVNETTRIIKSSFSWPEVTLLQQQQQQEKGECSSANSSLSNSSTMEHILESTSSLTFALRLDELTGSLFVRVINAQNLLAHCRNRQPTLMDSYVRIELLLTESDNTQGICLS